MTNFKVGQKVVCIKKDKWNRSNKFHLPKDNNSPKYGEICTIHSFRILGYIVLEEYLYDVDGCYLNHGIENFRPITYTTDAIPEILKNFSPKEETSDVPCKEVVNQNQQ